MYIYAIRLGAQVESQTGGFHGPVSGRPASPEMIVIITIITVIIILAIMIIVIIIIVILLVIIMAANSDTEGYTGEIRLRTTGVNTNGAAAEVNHFDRLGKMVRPGTFEKIKVR